MNRNSVLALVLLGAVLLTACNGSTGSPQGGTVPPATAEPTVVPTEVSPTAVPDEPVTTVLPPVAYSELAEVPTAAAPEVLEYFSALDLVWNTCRKFSGGYLNWQREGEEVPYLEMLLRAAGLDLDFEGPPYGLGLYVTEDTFVSREQFLDPNYEFCYALLLVTDFEVVELVAPDGRMKTGHVVPKEGTVGQLVYETPTGEFVTVTVYYGERPPLSTEEAYAFAKANCRPVEIGNGETPQC